MRPSWTYVRGAILVVVAVFELLFSFPLFFPFLLFFMVLLEKVCANSTSSNSEDCAQRTASHFVTDEGTSSTSKKACSQILLFIC